MQATKEIPKFFDQYLVTTKWPNSPLLLDFKCVFDHFVGLVLYKWI